MDLNPYSAQQADAITKMVNQNLSQTVMPGIASGALGNGSFGGSRQGVAEGIAAGNTQTGLSSALANLYGNNYQADQNFYTNQRGLDLQQTQLGSNLYGAGINGNAALGQGMYTTGQTGQAAPLTAVQQYGATISPYSGLGQSTVSTQSGSPAAGALGGAVAGNALSNLWSKMGNPSSGTFVADPNANFSKESWY